MRPCNVQSVLDKARLCSDAELLDYFKRKDIPGHNQDHAMMQAFAERFESLSKNVGAAQGQGVEGLDFEAWYEDRPRISMSTLLNKSPKDFMKEGWDGAISSITTPDPQGETNPKGEEA